MVFIDKGTAEIIAKRIEHAVSALVRGAVDQSMSGGAPGTAKNEVKTTSSKAKLSAASLPGQSA
jgi:Mn-dependent DtxR family transcriptional regulator